MHKILFYFIRPPPPQSAPQYPGLGNGQQNQGFAIRKQSRQNHLGHSNNYWYENNYDNGLCIKYYHILLGHHHRLSNILQFQSNHQDQIAMRPKLKFQGKIIKAILTIIGMRIIMIKDYA